MNKFYLVEIVGHLNGHSSYHFIQVTATHNFKWVKITHFNLIWDKTFANLDVQALISVPRTVIWSANKTDYLAVKGLIPPNKVMGLNQPLQSQLAHNICITFIQRWTNVFDVGPTLYKCYTNVSCLLGSYYRAKCISVNNKWYHPSPLITGIFFIFIHV